MDAHTYRDMHLLNEVTHSPRATQRELSTRIGVALGLTNLMLRRLAKKGHIKITGTKRSRIRYLITPMGILEKSRLTREFIQYSLRLYSHVRRFLREQLTVLAQAGSRRILLYGTGELAEIAFLTIQEMGLEFVGVVDETQERQRFLGHPVRRLDQIAPDEYDRIIVTVLQAGDGGTARLTEFGVPADRIISLPQPGTPGPVSEPGDAIEIVSGESRPVRVAVAEAVAAARPSPASRPIAGEAGKGVMAGAEVQGGGG